MCMSNNILLLTVSLVLYATLHVREKKIVLRKLQETIANPLMLYTSM